MKKVLILALAGLAGAASAQVGCVFDNVTNQFASGNGAFSTSSTPNTFMGGGFNLLAGTTAITGFDLYPVNVSGTNFDHLKINVWIWQTVNTSGTVNATTPAFSNLLGNYTLTSAGTFTTGFYFPIEGSPVGQASGVTLGVPLAISGTQIGMTFNYQGSTDGGLTYNSVNSLTSIISANNPNAVGTNVFGGYYRNANSETNGNFTSSLRSLGGLTNQSVAVRIYGENAAVPEPASMLAIGLGIAGLISKRRRK